jgi:DNA-binding NarL/FixJ family response regulator
MTDRALEELISCIYDVPLAHDGWMSLAATLEQHFTAPFAIFMLHPGKVVPVGASGPLDDEMVGLYSNELWREDRAMAALGSAPIGTLVLDSELVCQHERVKSPFYNDFMAPQGLERGLYASVARTRGSVLVASAQRSARFGDYGTADIKLMRRILPHLQRSFQTWQRLGEVEVERQAALEAVEHVAIGIALVDTSGKLHFANKAAEAQIESGAFGNSNGRVTARSSHATRTLQQAIEAAARDERPIAQRVTLPSRDGSPISVLVSPVTRAMRAGLHSDNMAILMIGGQQSNGVEAAAVGGAYGLTSAEARLLTALVQGERIPAYAQRHGISVATAKTHLRALFDKVGERRQADLIRRTVSDPVLWARPKP